MEQNKSDFIQFMLECNVLRFGEFTTKSGRQTPFFINTGMYHTGAQIAALGRFYAKAILDAFGSDFDCLYGPAYKGIPLVVTTSMALAEAGRDVPLAFNRKEAKDHGEGGAIVGHALRDGERVIIVEDVTTAGTSVHESMTLLRAIANVEVIGLVVSVDRQEQGTTPRGALRELADQYSLRTVSIVSLDEIVKTLHNREVDGRVLIDDGMLARINAYREQYGAH